jgi:hypothetical protein
MVTEPYFDADDNFIHRCCECGEEALFGYGVSLQRALPILKASIS